MYFSQICNELNYDEQKREKEFEKLTEGLFNKLCFLKKTTLIIKIPNPNHPTPSTESTQHLSPNTAYRSQAPNTHLSPIT